MEHTPEPWEFIDSKTIRGPYDGTAEKLGLLVAELPAWRSPGDAERIVACVNACGGLSTDRLKKFTGAESFRSLVTLMSDNAYLKQQRDELLAVLESLIDMDVSYNRGPKVENAVFSAREVIAKIKGDPSKLECISSE